MKVNSIKFTVSWITVIIIGCFLPNNGNGTFVARTDISGFGTQHTQNPSGDLHYKQYCLMENYSKYMYMDNPSEFQHQQLSIFYLALDERSLQVQINPNLVLEYY